MRFDLKMPHALLFLSLLIVTSAAALPVNVTRLKRHITELAAHNDLTPPAVQRILYTPSDVSARAYLKSLFSAADLSVHEDPLGNIFATWQGTEPGPAVLTGSHFDAIPNSGMYDGTLGILSGVEAILALKESGFVPRKSIKVLAFTSEEPTRFGLSCIGSRLLARAITPDQLAQLKDASDISFDTARSAAGYMGDIATVPLSSAAYSAFVELHSEQGPILEDTHTEIGVVTAIAAPAALSVTYTGPGGHAGTTLMSSRRDPSLAAAELSLAVEGAVKRFGGGDTVGTTGFLEIIPNAVNSVPTMAKIGIDVRDIDRERRDKVLEIVENTAKVIAKKRNVGVEVAVNSRDPPATCDDNIVNAVVDVANELDLTYRKMISRAYHDALFMAGIIPTGMIFVPCRGGVSHRPDEFVADRDMENGVKVLAYTLKRLAGDANGDKEQEKSAVGQHANETLDQGAKLSGDREDQLLKGDVEFTEPLPMAPRKEESDDTISLNQEAVQTQIIADVEDGEASDPTGGNLTELSTPSAATTTIDARGSTSRKTAVSDEQKTSEPNQPKESQTVEKEPVVSATKEQSKKPSVTMSDKNDGDKDESRETIKSDTGEESESVAEKPATNDENSRTASESTTVNVTDPAVAEREPNGKAMRPEQANSDASKRKNSEKVSARKPGRKEAEGRAYENGTTSRASESNNLGKQEKPDSAIGQPDSSDTKEDGEAASDFVIEGFDEPGKSFAGKKEEL